MLLPEYNYDFDAFGAPHLAEAHRAAGRLLLGHLVSAAVCCAALAAFAWGRPERAPLCALVLLALKAVHGAVAVAACHYFPILWGWLQVPASLPPSRPLGLFALSLLPVHHSPGYKHGTEAELPGDAMRVEDSDEEQLSSLSSPERGYETAISTE